MEFWKSMQSSDEERKAGCDISHTVKTQESSCPLLELLQDTPTGLLKLHIL